MNTITEAAMPIHINDAETEARVRKLAEVLGVGLTKVIGDIAGEELKRRGIPLPALSETIKHNAGLLGRLEQRMRSDTLNYTRLRNSVLGTRSGGSRVYQMLGLGPVEALRRLVLRPTDGLKFLLDNDALDLSAEMLALDPEFESVIPEDIRIRARANLAIVGVKAEDLKKIN
jgi:hypothetical protein